MSCQTTLGVEMQAVELDAPRRQHTRASVNENMEHHLQLGADNESVDDGYGELGRRRAVDSSRGTSVRQVIDTRLHLYKRPQYYYYYCTPLTASVPGRRGQAGNRKVKQLWI